MIMRRLLTVPLVFILTILALVIQLLLKTVSIAGGLIWLFLALFALLAFWFRMWPQLVAAGVLAAVIYLLIFAGSFLLVIVKEVRKCLI